MRWIRQSFRRQIFWIFLSVALILAISGGILTLQGYEARLRADYVRRDLQQAEAVNAQVTELLVLCRQALNSIARNQVIQSGIKAGTRAPRTVYGALYRETGEIRDYSVTEIYEGEICVYATSSQDRQRTLPLNYAVLREALEAGGGIVAGQDPLDMGESGSSLLMARQISFGDMPGFAVIRIREEDLKAWLKGSLNAGEGYALLDSFFRPFCLLGQADDMKAVSQIRNNLLTGEGALSGVEEAAYISELSDTGLLGIYMTKPVRESFFSERGYQIIVLLVVISVILSLIASVLLSGYFSKPIHSLVRGMRRLRKGDLDVRIESDREDEFGLLANGFNKMAEQLKDYMQEQVAAERTLNETRLAMMQAQLNPHFLYNTLDTIKWMAKLHGAPEVGTISADLAKILRASIAGDRFCSLESELELVKNYCEIQQFRFDDSFELLMDVPPELSDAQVPKLILQPIVENSIIHGLEGHSNGHIRIEARREAEDMVIRVTDDGNGISDEIIEAVQSKDPEALSGHLGLGNVNTILRLYYGEKYGLQAERPPEGGTRMTIRLPYAEDMEEGKGTDGGQNE